MEARIRKEAETDIAEDLRKMAQNIEDVDSIMREIGDFVWSVMQESFAQSKSPTGEAWRALSSTTIQLKVKRGFPALPLVRTGRLKNGILVNVVGQTVEIGFSPDADYASFHQEGTSNIPSRPLVTGLTQEDNDTLIGMIRAHIEQGVKGAQPE